jgi:selenocysteine-specific elongation factor
MRHVVIGTAGHIDHGKSTLVRALTGIDPDRLKEEKARGITIDLGFAHDVQGDVTLAFVDVPGHERFVKNMLAGATGIDVLLLVVAADESVMPQTREHFDICRLLEVSRGVVALTKADLVDDETLELVKLEVRELVAGSSLAGAPVIPVSAAAGSGLDALRSALLVAAADAPSRRRDGLFRLPIDRVFSVKGFGTVVTGTVVSGVTSVDDTLEVLPPGRTVKVRALQGHGMSLSQVGAGQRAAINLSGVDLDDLTRGDSLVTPNGFQATRRLDAAIEILGSARPLKHGARVRFHQGTGETLGRVAIATALVDAPGAGPPTVAEVPSGTRAHVRLRLEAPVVVTRGDRFVLRAYSPPVTIAGGVVLDPDPPRSAIRSAAGRERFARLDPTGTDGIWSTEAIDRAIRTLATERGGRGLTTRALVSRVGLPPADAERAVRRLAASGVLRHIGDLLVSRAVLDALAGAVTALLAQYHKAQPLSDGMPREEVRERVFSRADDVVFDAVIQRLVDEGRVVARDRLSLASHRVTLSAEEEEAQRRVDAAFRSAGLRPPDVATLTSDLRLPEAAVQNALKLLQRRKALVKIDELWFHADALERLKAEVRALKQGTREARLDVAAFKDRYGVSRKFAIPLLEYLDRERVTRRIGDARVVL